MPVHELDGARNFRDLIDATSGKVYSGNRNLFLRRAFLSFLLKGGRWAFDQNWRLFGLSRLLMKLEGRLTGSPHTIKLESFAHLFLLIQVSLATAYLIWQRGHGVDAALDLVAQNFLLFKLADHEVFDGHFLFSLFNLPELLRVGRQGLVIGTHCLLLLER